MLTRDFFLDKQREKAKLEAEMKMMVTLRQIIPAGEAKPVAPLGVLLSQYYLNLAEFCKDFNAKTKHWEEGVELPVKVKKGLRAKEYILLIFSPTYTFLIDNSLIEDNLFLSVAYDIACIKATFDNKTIRSSASLLFSSLKSHEDRKRIYRHRRYKITQE